jgi:SAM-dependent methyltransferase
MTVKLPGSLVIAAALTLTSTVPLAAQEKPFVPVVGQAGKDVVWVPTSPALVEKMLDMARVTPQDIVMDLGSGDGRNIIAAARRGATAVGVEFNPDMVALANRLAKEAGVAEKATFIERDMYAADISNATVMALFLLPDNLGKLRDKFMALRPGSRLVLNTFGIPDWEADARETIQDDCISWCTSLLYYVPAKVGGTWKTPRGELTLAQSFQNVTGTLTDGGKTVTVTGKLRGDQITLNAGGTELTGQVRGDRIEGGDWSAVRAGPPALAVDRVPEPTLYVPDVTDDAISSTRRTFFSRHVN